MNDYTIEIAEHYYPVRAHTEPETNVYRTTTRETALAQAMVNLFEMIGKLDVLLYTLEFSPNGWLNTFGGTELNIHEGRELNIRHAVRTYTKAFQIGRKRLHQFDGRKEKNRAHYSMFAQVREASIEDLMLDEIVYKVMDTKEWFLVDGGTRMTVFCTDGGRVAQELSGREWKRMKEFFAGEELDSKKYEGV